MFNNNLLYILTILEAIEKISIYIKTFTDVDEFYYSEDQKSFNATVNLLIVIGEESKKIDASIKFNHKNVNWKLLAGLRDKISHDYRGIDPEIIWSVVNDDLKILKTEIILVFKELNIDQTFLLEIINSQYYNHLRYLLKDSENEN